MESTKTIDIKASSLKSIFIKSALALSGCAGGKSKTAVKNITLEALDDETLLIYWIDQLKSIVDDEGFCLTDVNIDMLSNEKIKAKIFGLINADCGCRFEGHPIDAEIIKNNNTFRARIIFN